MTQDANHLIWIDLEMTGLQPDTDRILEVAAVITDSNLNPIAESPALIIHQAESVLAGMDNWNKSTHGKSGLLDKVKNASLNEMQAQQQMLAFISNYVPQRCSPMCGNSICQDRRFLARWMPQLEAWFHYRNLDVSSIKELVNRWQPKLAKGVLKSGKHQALIDIYESIEELKYYRQFFFKV